MIGPMKKKMITATIVTAVVLILIFTVIFVLYISQTNKKISELQQKGEVVQRYVFTKDLPAGSVITTEDVKYVDVKGESAPIDSYEFKDETVNGRRINIDQMYDIIGRRLKVNVNEKMIVTSSLFFEEDKAPNLDTRLQEFNMITLPSDLNVGDYVDIRIRFATGEDFIVLVGKKIEAFGATGSSSNTIFLKLNEEEINRMASAIIESYINNGIKLYANKYVDPSNQLFEYHYVDLIAKYEEVKYTADSTYDIVSGELVERPSNTERTNEEIASLLGISVSEVEDIKTAIANKDEKALSYYQNKLVTMEKSIITNYPVKEEVANLIRSNPNIIEEVKAKYNVEELLIERATLPNTDVSTESSINSVKEKLDKEIATQRTERQEYLLKLISNQNTSSN